MERVEAAARIVELQDALLTSILGVERRAACMREQADLWDSHFSGVPYERVLGTLRPSMPSPAASDGVGSASAA